MMRSILFSLADMNPLYDCGVDDCEAVYSELLNDYF